MRGWRQGGGGGPSLQHKRCRRVIVLRGAPAPSALVKVGAVDNVPRADDGEGDALLQQLDDVPAVRAAAHLDDAEEQPPRVAQRRDPEGANPEDAEPEDGAEDLAAVGHGGGCYGSRRGARGSRSGGGGVEQVVVRRRVRVVFRFFLTSGSVFLPLQINEIIEILIGTNSGKFKIFWRQNIFTWGENCYFFLNARQSCTYAKISIA